MKLSEIIHLPHFESRVNEILDFYGVYDWILQKHEEIDILAEIKDALKKAFEAKQNENI